MKKRILVTGKNGLVGQAIKSVADLCENEYFFAGREEADLTNKHDVESLFKFFKPDYVIHAAAKVGGIGGNINEPAAMFYDNIMINTHVIHQAWKYGVEKLLAFSSVCVFPDGIPVLREDLMQQGEPYHTQFAYGSAKRAIDAQIRAYKKQYGDRQFASVIPCNIFGISDYYNLQNGHVIPSLINKLHTAIRTDTPFVVWGDGSAKREFIYSHDLAVIALKLLSLDKIPERILVSNNNQMTIKQVVDTLVKITDFKGKLVWDTSKPNGQHARPTDLSLLRSLIGDYKYTDMEKALSESYHWFADNLDKARL
jgi:GDP-L-fucose synthase